MMPFSVLARCVEAVAGEADKPNLVTLEGRDGFVCHDGDWVARLPCLKVLVDDDTAREMIGKTCKVTVEVWDE